MNETGLSTKNLTVPEQVIRTNLISHMNDAHAVIPLFRRQGHGIFINMISLGAFAPTPFAASYSASKFGLRGFSEALRGEVSDQPDIHICDVYPTFVDAPGMPHAANYTGRRISVPPLAGDPRKIAELIVSLAVKPRDSTVLGAASHLARLGHLFAPNLSARMMARLTRAYLARAPAAPITNGALFGPPARHAGIYSGSHDGDRPPAISGSMLAIGLGLVSGAIALAMVSRRRGEKRE